MRTADFDYFLPPELIAQHPAPQRDKSRLLVLHREKNQLEHRQFRDFPTYLRSGDVLVFNNSRVIPARLRGVNVKTGGAFEILLLDECGLNCWWTMLKPGKRARVGTRIQIGPQPAEGSGICATVTEVNAEGHRRLEFNGTPNIAEELDKLGEIPLPPYIARAEGGLLESDKQRYQTVFAQPPGSVAAPTAGLHFTEPMLAALRAQGIEIHFVTLHVGLGTFAPVKAETLAGHTMHEERFEVGETAANAINKAKQEHRRVIAVGTTSVRVLETLADQNAGRIVAGSGRTNIFIHPPRQFKIVDALLTNFHLPCSTLLMLVSAFASPTKSDGRQTVLSAYGEAVRERYRFFSYGDAMLLL